MSPFLVSEQRKRYEARLKFQRDEAARTKSAREEGEVIGEQRGIEKGELFGQIKTLQSLAGVVESTRAELSSLSVGQLSEMGDATARTTSQSQFIIVASKPIVPIFVSAEYRSARSESPIQRDQQSF